MLMKKIVLVLLMMVSLVSQVWAAEKDITSRDAKALLDRNKNIYLLDVRTPQEYSQGKLAGSVLIPIGEFERRVGEVPKNKTIIVYCAVGSRSKPVANFLAQRGHKDVYNMTDGIVGWYRNKFPIQR
ncbi:MAG: rhodanese-like domain-containing protein [Geobacteraceae bacterium GWC2_53_11]|nr:MAG: rhodanese-like domain-containing protein [Geobacteraceae bacterium GWC2_53_11]